MHLLMRYLRIGFMEKRFFMLESKLIKNWVWLGVQFGIISLVVASFYIWRESLTVYFLSSPQINGAIIFLLIITAIVSLFGQVKDTLWTNRILLMLASKSKTEERVTTLLFKILFKNSNLEALFKSFSDKQALTRDKVDYFVFNGLGSVSTSLRFSSTTMVSLGLIGTFLGLSLTMASLSELISGLSNNSAGTDMMGSLMQGLPTAIGGMGVAFHTSLYGISSSLLGATLLYVYQKSSDSFSDEISKYATEYGLVLEGLSNILAQANISASKSLEQSSRNLQASISEAMNTFARHSEHLGELQSQQIDGYARIENTLIKNNQLVEPISKSIFPALEVIHSNLGEQITRIYEISKQQQETINETVEEFHKQILLSTKLIDDNQEYFTKKVDEYKETLIESASDTKKFTHNFENFLTASEKNQMLEQELQKKHFSETKEWVTAIAEFVGERLSTDSKFVENTYTNFKTFTLNSSKAQNDFSTNIQNTSKLLEEMTHKLLSQNEKNINNTKELNDQVTHTLSLNEQRLISEQNDRTDFFEKRLLLDEALNSSITQLDLRLEVLTKVISKESNSVNLKKTSSDSSVSELTNDKNTNKKSSSKSAVNLGDPKKFFDRFFK